MDFIKPLLLTRGLKFLKKVCKIIFMIWLKWLSYLQYCYTHTDRVYATVHRTELKNNILTLLLLTIMTKELSLLSFLVQHSHLLWLCYKLILPSVSVFCHKSENKSNLKEMGKDNNSGCVQHLNIQSKCK